MDFHGFFRFSEINIRLIHVIPAWPAGVFLLHLCFHRSPKGTGLKTFTAKGFNTGKATIQNHSAPEQ